MNRNQLRVVMYDGKKAYFHQWLKKAFEDSNFRKEYSYALIELEDGTLEEVEYDDIKFMTTEEVLNMLDRYNDKA